MYEGFLPVYDSESEILILGSFPSVKSREKQFYYGNERNRFWKLISEIYGDECGENTEDKIKFLKRHKIALWDIVMSCEIEGSKDEKITDYKVADIESLLKKSKIKRVLLNGKRAEEIYLKNFSNLSVKIYPLPSTSPRNYKFDKAKWSDALLK